MHILCVCRYIYIHVFVPDQNLKRENTKLHSIKCLSPVTKEKNNLRFNDSRDDI